MGDPHELPPQTSEIKHVLPDVVHSQQILGVGDAVAVPTEAVEIDTSRNNENENVVSHNIENSETESISEHIPSKIEYSVTDSDNIKIDESEGQLKVEDEEKVSKHSSLNVPYTFSLLSENATQNQSQHSSSWPLEGQPSPDVHPLSEESPVVLASSELSKEATDDKSHHESLLPSEQVSSNNSSKESDETPKQSQREEDLYLDSLNEEDSRISNISIGEDSLRSSQSGKVESDKSSGSEEIIKLDIRGKGVPKFPLSSAKIIFGPPPEGSTVIGPNVEPLPVFQNLLSPFLVGVGDNVKVEEVYDHVEMPYKDPSLERSPEQSPEKDPSPRQSGEDSMVNSFSSDKAQQDLLVEEVTVDYETREKDEEIPEKLEDTSIPTQPKSLVPDDTISFSTLTTDYKTICEEYHVKLVHLEDAISQRDELIEELTVSLQRSVKEQDQLRTENVHLTTEVQNLQHIVAEHSHSEHDTIKAQLSDFMKYESLVKDDSTKFYSALMSGGSSVQSSNGEKYNENEEITVHYSHSDLKSGSSEDFQTGFENKLTSVINKFDEYIEENLRNKLRESIIQVLCEEIGKMRIESDTELRDVETQMQQEKQTYTVETRKLRELLASVKAGNADIDTLRKELNIKHEKEMENLRTYFEKKCSDMERSYSEEVWRGRACASPTSLSSAEVPDGAGAGDHARRRTRSAEFPSLTYEPSQFEQALKQASKRYDQQAEELKTEHAAVVSDMRARHAETVAALEQQIIQLKAHIQTTENTEANVSLYQQDIDLELEKKEDFERRLEEVRQEVAQQLQDQIQVLLSDPDAEVSSWPLELVALREKIHETRSLQDKDISSIREESLGGGAEADKWRQRRNLSFDQNRQLEEVTKERDGLKRVAASLQRAVSQLVAYCACAEDELNRTLLARLLARRDHDESSIHIEDESRPSTPNVDLSTSLISKGKHVHFAPDLQAILTDLDEEGLAGFLAQQRDVSADIKRELEISLKRLRNEAHDLLDLSEKLAAHRRPETKMLESGSQVQMTELVEQMDGRGRRCSNCELHRKNMEEAMAECLQRENLLRGDLESAMIKIAQLMTSADAMHSSDLIAEGYGCVPPLQPPTPLRRARPDSGSQSLDGGGGGSPRGHLNRMQRDIDMLQKERDDLQQQLEAANRQLRSTRQFVEEQAGEREAERDEFARRLAELRDENSRLATRLQNNARILNEMHCLRLSRCNCRAHDAHVEQLEAQTREMNQIIAELETRKTATDDELKSQEEKVILLRDIINNLETQLEQKTTHEAEILEQLEQMKNTIDDRDRKMRALVGELESLRSERLEQSDVMCVRCGMEEDRYEQLREKVREQSRLLEDKIHRRTRRLEQTHEVASASCSEPSEDVSVRRAGQVSRYLQRKVQSPSELSPSPRVEPLEELSGVWECLEGLGRAEEAAVKRIADLDMQRAQLKQVAQEVRAERDVLQARMSEQALKISSLAARLQRQRNDADALAQGAASQLTVQLHDTLAEVQRLKEELESKDKQIARMKLTVDDKELGEQNASLYGNSCNPKDKVIILERELSSAQSRIAQLESLARALDEDKEQLQAALRTHQKALAEKEAQLQGLQGLLALNFNDIDKDEKSEVEGKVSARTLSDIVSISEFDEQDLQMRKAELKGQNMNLSGAPYDTNKSLNKTLPPESQKPNLSSLNLDYADHFDFTTYSPRADSLPAHLTSTQNKDFLKPFKRNVNETTIFGTIGRVEDSIKNKQHNIPDNCSLYPNRDISDSKNVSVEPKKINFSLEASKDNKTHIDEEFTSLRELGITIDIKQENFPDILTQLKHDIKKSRSELERCKSELKHAEEQLCEFPALKEEVEELKSLLENTMATMENDKKFYENQLENFSSNKNLLEQRLTELTQEVNDKSKDLHLLKEDILRRENMILELAKEKRNLTNKITELGVKLDELQSRNNLLEKYESENHQMREKISELQKLEQLITEKNQQIDSLNQHLDRHDDLQRCLNDKTEEFENLKEAYEEKSAELDHLQDSVEALKSDVAKLNQDNNDLINTNKDLKLKLTKVEKEQENASLRLQNSETELERVNSLNNELTSKIEELKQLTDKLKDKETEIEILHEDINSYHEEIASLKEQLKMVSRSPSPRKTGEEKNGEDKRSQDRHASNDKKQLVKIRKQISLLQHELDYHRKELNDKAFELAKAKLDVTELKSSVSQAQKQANDKEVSNCELMRRNEDLQREVQALAAEKQALRQQLEMVVARLREESNLGELKAKLQEKSDRCFELEQEMQDLKDLVERLRAADPAPPAHELALVRSGARSPTAELELALRDQLNYSHTLDEDIMEQILSASSDDRDHMPDIPRLALNTSKSSSSIQSSGSERLQRVRGDNERLQLQVNNLELRLKDKDALIAELNRVRDKLVQDWQTSKLQLDTERDNSGRLQLLLDTQKETSESLQHQDSNMIQILKKRLESAMQSELELQQREQQLKARAAQLERQLLTGQGGDASKRQLQHEMETNERLKGEISLLKSKLEVERNRYVDLQAVLDQTKMQLQRELDAKTDACNTLRSELVDLKRLKHEAGVELLRAKDLLSTQASAIAELQQRLTARAAHTQLTEIESHKVSLAHEIANLKKCIVDSSAPELAALRAERQQLLARCQALEAGRSAGREAGRAAGAGTEEKEQAIRYLHGRCLRLESCRKALVWQKWYLQRVLSGYTELERTLRLPTRPPPATGRGRFKCAATAVLGVLRMQFLVRRRQHVRALASAALLGPAAPARPAPTAHTPSQYNPSASPPSRDRSGAGVSPPAASGAGRPDGLARRLLKQDLRHDHPLSPMGDFMRRSPYAANSPRDDPIGLSSPNREVATAYLNKLDLVSRCLHATRDAP